MTVGQIFVGFKQLDGSQRGPRNPCLRNKERFQKFDGRLYNQREEIWEVKRALGRVEISLEILKLKRWWFW